jgi:hypothetical protein
LWKKVSDSCLFLLGLAFMPSLKEINRFTANYLQKKLPFFYHNNLLSISKMPNIILFGFV